MNKPATERELELRSDYQDVRRGNCDKGGKSWLNKRRYQKKSLHRFLRRLGKLLTVSD